MGSMVHYSSSSFKLVLCGILLMSVISLTMVEGGYRVIMRPVAGPFQISESPHWDCQNGVLYFVDQETSRACVYNPKTGRTDCTCMLDSTELSPIIPIQNTKNQFFVGVAGCAGIMKWDGCCCTKPDVTIIGCYDSDFPGLTIEDAKAGPNGILYVSTASPVDENGNRGRVASIYYYNPETAMLESRLRNDARIYDGIAYDLYDNYIYVAASAAGEILRYQFDPNTGNLTNRQPIFNFNNSNVPGFPDGIAITANNTIWCACNGGGRLIEVDPATSDLLQTLELPDISRPTSVAFGGCNLDQMYVTSNRADLSPEELEQEPLAGSVFLICGIRSSGTPGQNIVMVRSCCIGCGCQNSGQGCCGGGNGNYGGCSGSYGSNCCEGGGNWGDDYCDGGCGNCVEGCCGGYENCGGGFYKGGCGNCVEGCCGGYENCRGGSYKGGCGNNGGGCCGGCGDYDGNY